MSDLGDGAPLVAVRIEAKKDEFGNPRKGWLVWRVSGSMRAFDGFVNEGYEGVSAIVRTGALVLTGSCLKVPVWEYRAARLFPFRRGADYSQRAWLEMRNHEGALGREVL